MPAIVSTVACKRKLFAACFYKRYTGGMLQLSGNLLGQPVLSLRDGGAVALTTEAIINPNNLKIEGFYCEDAEGRILVLLYQDIRDHIMQGFIVNDIDALTEPEELVRLRHIMDLNFSLLGKPVMTLSKEKLGKVGDFSTETTTMFVKKLYVSQSIFKNLASGNLGIDRNQIVEITDTHIVVQDLLQPTQVPAGAQATA
jgi:sporulation protein YlmC with PRC-barrel domain